MTTPSASTSSLRRLLLLLFVFGSAGLAAELLLTGHFEEWRQTVPLVLLFAGVVAALPMFGRPAVGAVRVFGALGWTSVVAGVAGVALHLQGNLEFARENDPSLGGFALVVEMLMGATPALAPGALAQLGLLGVLITHRHPALRGGASFTTNDDT